MPVSLLPHADSIVHNAATRDESTLFICVIFLLFICLDFFGCFLGRAKSVEAREETE
jgi:hypothetical protein